MSTVTEKLKLNKKERKGEDLWEVKDQRLPFSRWQLQPPRTPVALHFQDEGLTPKPAPYKLSSLHMQSQFSCAGQATNTNLLVVLCVV